jgi:hypothetical protein
MHPRLEKKLQLQGVQNKGIGSLFFFHEEIVEKIKINPDRSVTDFFYIQLIRAFM